MEVRTDTHGQVTALLPVYMYCTRREHCNPAVAGTWIEGDEIDLSLSSCLPQLQTKSGTGLSNSRIDNAASQWTDVGSAYNFTHIHTTHIHRSPEQHPTSPLRGPHQQRASLPLQSRHPRLRLIRLHSTQHPWYSKLQPVHRAFGVQRNRRPILHSPLLASRCDVAATSPGAWLLRLL